LEGQARFNSGSNAHVTAIHVYDGPTKIAELEGISRGGKDQKVNINLGAHRMGEAMEISVLVNSSGTGSQAWIQFSGAGIEFDDVSEFLSVC
jgi:hypothetical protein